MTIDLKIHKIDLEIDAPFSFDEIREWCEKDNVEVANTWATSANGHPIYTFFSEEKNHIIDIAYRVLDVDGKTFSDDMIYTGYESVLDPKETLEQQAIFIISDVWAGGPGNYEMQYNANGDVIGAIANGIYVSVGDVVEDDGTIRHNAIRDLATEIYGENPDFSDFDPTTHEIVLSDEELDQILTANTV